jgi:hypothetical protein
LSERVSKQALSMAAAVAAAVAAAAASAGKDASVSFLPSQSSRRRHRAFVRTSVDGKLVLSQLII